MTIEELREQGLIAYEFVRGSWAHGIAVEGKSDIDIGGVFICPKEKLLGLRSDYVEQVSDKKGDVVFYEFGRWMELLLKSNPTVLESLFINPKYIIGDVHPAVQHIIDNRDMFLTKEAFNPLIGYSVQQIKKATGYNKKCQIPENFQRKDVLDFCFTFRNQGSQPIKKYLSNNFLDQKYCGLVNIPNMRDVYGVYYDWAAFLYFETSWKCGWESVPYPYNKFIKDPMDIARIKNRIMDKDFYGYEGIVNPDDYSKSNDIRLSSVHEGDKPICYLYFNKDGYASHCKDYREWMEWKEKRNQTRYTDNKGYNFDAKNMCETVRLIHTGIELARDGVFNVERTWDRDFLLDIKNHKVTYDEIMTYVKGKKAEFDEYLKTSKLPDKVDFEKVNNLLIEARKMFYKL